MILLRAALGFAAVVWVVWWATVLWGRWHADPVAVVVGLLLFAGWLAVHRRVRRS